MRRSIAALAVCLAVTPAVISQGFSIKPVHVPAGTVLTFYLQTRLNSNDAKGVDLLPKGTQISVRMLESVDSATNKDGSEFRGTLATSVVCPDGVVIPADAEVKGLFALLRSKNHPDGFRYELLITEITDGEKSFRLTASLNSSFVDSAASSVSKTKESTSSSETATAGVTPAHR